LPYILGFVLGDIVWFTVAATGLAALATQFETAFIIFKYAGCAYLIWMAWKIWMAPVAAVDVIARTESRSGFSDFSGTLLLTLSNPKVIVFMLSLMPLAVDVKALTIPVYAMLAATMGVICFSSIFVVLQLAERAKRVFKSAEALKRINRTSAGLMAGAAVLVATKS